jgi:2-polyprenyl-3-methyl-5-hydroxy-6-metoxy-1,4-benzoquinol methylase
MTTHEYLTSMTKSKAGEKFWDWVSGGSDSGDATKSPLLKAIDSHSHQYLHATDTVLDLGCGPGGLTLELARKTQMVYGVDISGGMIEVARAKAEAKNVWNVKFIKGDLFSEDFEPNTFDVIVAFNVLKYISDRKRLYKRMHELLRPDGLFISATACLGERKSVLRLVLSAVTKLGIVPEMTFLTIAELEDEITSSGFTMAEAQSISEVPERFLIARRGS